MEIVIESKEPKPLVERDELILKVTGFTATPSRAAIIEEISKLIPGPKENIVVKKIYQHYGKQEARVLVYVYYSQEAMKKFEKRKKKEKKAQEAQQTTQE